VRKVGTALKLAPEAGVIEAEEAALKPLGVLEVGVAVLGVAEPVTALMVVSSHGCMSCFTLGKTEEFTDSNPATFSVDLLVRDGVATEPCVNATLGATTALGVATQLFSSTSLSINSSTLICSAELVWIGGGLIKAGTALKLPAETGVVEEEVTAPKPRVLVATRGVVEPVTALMVVSSRGCMPCFTLGRTVVVADSDPATFGVDLLIRDGVVTELCVNATSGGTKPSTICTGPVTCTHLAFRCRPVGDPAPIKFTRLTLDLTTGSNLGGYAKPCR